MSEPTDQTIDLAHVILREMRSNFARIEHKVDSLELRVENLDAKADVTNERLDVVVHLVSDAASQIRFVGRHSANVEKRHDKEIAALRERIARLEDNSDDEQ